MKIKLLKIVNSVNSLKLLTSQQVNAKLAFKLSKILNIIQQELDLFEKTKIQVANKYNITDSSPEEDKLKFKQEILDLLEEEVEINIDQLSVMEFGNIQITVSNMMTMEYLFKE